MLTTIKLLQNGDLGVPPPAFACFECRIRERSPMSTTDMSTTPTLRPAASQPGSHLLQPVGGRVEQRPNPVFDGPGGFTSIPPAPFFMPSQVDLTA